jgi:hypothetical protein
MSLLLQIKYQDIKITVQKYRPSAKELANGGPLASSQWFRNQQTSLHRKIKWFVAIKQNIV